METQKIRVLLADDSDEMCDILKSFFELTHDIDVCGTVADGEDAVQKIHLLCPDIVLLDIIMPKLDGLSVLERLKETPPPKKPCILVLSAVGQEKVTALAMALGADYYMIKPYDLEALLQRIYLLAGKPRFPKPPPSGSRDFTGLITEYVIRMGVPPHFIGYNYIIEALLILTRSNRPYPIAKQIYSSIAEKYCTSIDCVEGAVRKTIDRAFHLRNEPFQDLMRMIPSEDGKKPSNNQFLSALSEKIKLDISNAPRSF